MHDAFAEAQGTVRPQLEQPEQDNDPYKTIYYLVTKMKKENLTNEDIKKEFAKFGYNVEAINHKSDYTVRELTEKIHEGLNRENKSGRRKTEGEE